MKFEQRSFGRGTLRLEVMETTLRYERATVSGRHSFEAPLSEFSRTIEEWQGTSVIGYGAALLCAVLLVRAVVTAFELSLWMLSVDLILVAGIAYFFIQARARSGRYYIVRNTREPGRDIWILRSGHEREVESLISVLRQAVDRLKQSPNKEPEPMPGSVRPHADA